MSNKWMVGFFVVSIVLIVGAVGRIVIKEIRNVSSRGDSPASRENLMRIASNLNKSMPIQIDKDMVIQNVSAVQGQLIYNYRFLNLKGSEVNRDFVLTKGRELTKNRNCSDPDSIEFWKNGIALVYSYSGSDGIFVAEFAVTAKDCAH